MAKPRFRTGVYSKDSAEIIRRVFIWISTKETPNGHASPNSGLSTRVLLEQNPDNEVVVTTRIDTWTRLSRFIGREKDFKAWLAYQIKSCFYDLYDKNFWCRYLPHEVDFMSDPHEYMGRPKFFVPYSAFYFLYETLLQRKKSLAKYDAKLVERFGGTQNDPILTEAETQRRQELEALEREYDCKCAELKRQKDQEIADFYTALETKYNALKKEAHDLYVIQHKALEDLKYVA